MVVGPILYTYEVLIHPAYQFHPLVGPTVCGHAPHTVLLCIMVDHQLLNVDNHYDSLIKYAISIGYSCLN